MKAKTRNPQKEPESKFIYVDVSSVDNTCFKITAPSFLYGKEAPSRARKIIQTNDVIFATVRPTLQRIAYITEEFNNQICSTGYCVLKSKNSLDSKFLYYWLLTDFVLKEVEKIQRGASYPAIRDSELKNLEIPLPPLEEQKKIASVLRFIQEAIEEQKREIALTTELKQNLMQKLFTEGLNNEPQKMTEIGLIPESWDVVSLDTLLKETETVNLKKEGNRHISYIDVSSISRDFLNIEKTTEYILKNAPSRARKKVKQGDVIFATIRPTLLRVATIPPEYDNQICSTAFCVLRNKDSNLSGKFIYYLVQRPQFIAQLQSIESGASYPAVTDRQVKAQLVPIPEKKEQYKIVQIFENCDDSISLFYKKKEQLQELFKILLHQLMTAQIRVDELDLTVLEEII